MELRNRVKAVEEEVEGGSIEGVELLFLTNNSVEEALYYWVNSSDKGIFKLMLQLVYLDFRGCFRLYIILVARTRLIAPGIDGFYKGCLIDGIASSSSILEFVPLNGTAFERSVSLFP